MSLRLSGINPLSYVGAEPLQPPNLVVIPRSPTTRDSQNFNIGTLWVVLIPSNPAQEIWMLVNLAQGIATWVQLYPGAGGGATEFPTDAGTANEAGGILNVFGDGTITTSGAGNTITIHANLDIATNFDTDAGSAVPVADTLNIFGGDNINTAGAGNTVTINLNTSISQPNTNASGTEGLYSLGNHRFLHNFGTRNTFLGQDSGNQTLVNADDNTGIGFAVLQSLVSGDENVSLGSGSLLDLQTGSDNVAIGFGAGSNYTGAESGNLLLDNAGVLAENATIRIGTAQTAAYMAGVYGATVGLTNQFVIIDNTGKLGTGGGAGGSSEFFFARQSATAVGVTGNLT